MKTVAMTYEDPPEKWEYKVIFPKADGRPLGGLLRSTLLQAGGVGTERSGCPRLGAVRDRRVLLLQAGGTMKYQFTESHFVLEFEGKARIKMTLDEADRLRGIIERALYHRDRQFKKVKEQQDGQPIETRQGDAIRDGRLEGAGGRRTG